MAGLEPKLRLVMGSTVVGGFSYPIGLKASAVLSLTKGLMMSTFLPPDDPKLVLSCG